jgi:glycerol-3-phosphate dehydrogenase (NAD(P)+)
MKISILGCGNWGSVFGIMQYRNGHEIRIWEYDRPRAERIKETRDNAPYLVGHPIPEGIAVEWEIAMVLEQTDLLVFAVPSSVLAEVVTKVAGFDLGSAACLSLIKGIDQKTLKRPSELIAGIANACRGVFVLSGPSIANEIARGEPTAVVLVGSDERQTRHLQHQLSTENFRIYQGTDLVGVELGAAIKNVIALACGMSDGLGFGSNAKGALIARGIVEMHRLGIKMGAQTKTFWGLSGLGDLVTTCFSEESRNHRLGKAIGQGRDVIQASSELVMVAEGMPTARAVKDLARRMGVEMPICEVVHGIIYGQKSPKQGIRDLMSRPLKYE